MSRPIKVSAENTMGGNYRVVERHPHVDNSYGLGKIILAEWTDPHGPRGGNTYRKAYLYRSSFPNLVKVVLRALPELIAPVLQVISEVIAEQQAEQKEEAS